MIDANNKELHRIALTAIIYREDGKYLLTKRAPHKIFPNKWTVPGGGMSTDDYINTPHQHEQWYKAVELALTREIREEVNVEIGPAEYLTNLTFIRQDKIPVLVLSFYAPYVSGEVKFNDGESTDFAWVKYEEAKKYDLIPGIIEEIRLADERLRERSSF